MLDAPPILNYAKAPNNKGRRSHWFWFTLIWLVLILFAYTNPGSIGWAYYLSNEPGDWLVSLAFPFFPKDFYLTYMPLIWGIACLITVMLAATLMDLLRVPRWIYLAWLPLLLAGVIYGWIIREDQEFATVAFMLCCSLYLQAAATILIVAIVRVIAGLKRFASRSR